MRILKYWKPILISLFILYASITTGEKFEKVHFINIPNFDKIVHFIFYLLLSISLYTSLNRNTLIKKSDQVIINLVLVISYGLIIEMLQYYLTSNRQAEIFDVIANTLGCISGILIFPVLNKIGLAKYL
jgi:VanZ family protein